jgi:diguanylate cyclase (GGDEF)-like protein
MRPTPFFRRLERFTARVFAVALAALVLGVVAAGRHVRELKRAQGWVTHTYDVIGGLSRVEATVRAAESAERAFALTGDSLALGPVDRVQGEAAEALAAVRALVADNPAQTKRAAALAAAVDGKVAAMHALVRARRERGRDAAAARVAAGHGPREMLAVERAVGEMKARELQLLARRRDDVVASTAASGVLVELLAGGALVLLGVAFVSVAGARARQRAAEERAAAVHDELRVRVAELEARGRESRTLSQLSEALQLCLTPGEAHDAVARVVPALLELPASGGVLAVVRASRNRVERVASWGALAGEVTLAFAPEECCALRSGRQYAVRAGEARLRCAHVAADVDDYVCLPLSAHGETLGVLHVAGAALHGARGEGREPLALLREAGEHVAVALANLALRDRLRQQSIRDPLTGAFNRRYLEESLDREVARARRHGHGLGLLMLDVDHFKRVNDVHGHEAGDEVLRATGELLRRAVREEDVVCRYGGEEFAVLLPDVTEEVANARALHILAAVRGQQVAHRGEPVGSVTASVGVAMFPQHGAEGTDVLRRADEALYAAKRAGRDRVVAAGV